MLSRLLAEKRDEILRKWTQAVIATYPPDARPYLQRDHNPFANPVGAAISGGIAELFDRMADEAGDVCLPPLFLDLIKVRAVQDFTASQAVSFVPDVKRVVRLVLGPDAQRPELADEWRTFDERVDCFTLAAFDAFMGARERLYDVRAGEIAHRSSLLLARAGLTGAADVKCPSQLDGASCGNCDDEER